MNGKRIVGVIGVLLLGIGLTFLLFPSQTGTIGTRHYTVYHIFNFRLELPFRVPNILAGNYLVVGIIWVAIVIASAFIFTGFNAKKK